MLTSRDRLQTWLDKFAANKQYDRVFLLDIFGLERISKPDKSEPAAAHFAKDIAVVFNSGNITFLDFHRDTPDGPIHLALLVPIFDDKNNSRPLSVLVLRIDPNVYLYPYIQTWPVPSKTSETLIARREGNAALFLNELKFQKNTALKFQIPLKKTATPVVEAVLGHEGTMEGTDYRGVRVLAAIRSVPDSPWFLVARTDIGEVFAPLRARLLQMVLFICIILAGIGGCLFLLLKQQRMRHYREKLQVMDALQESERRLSEAQKMAQLGHWDWDIKTGKVVWSDEVFKIFRIDPKNFTPHIDSILELSPWPEDHERDKELIRRAMESHEKGSYEQRFLRPDKSIGYYDSTFRGKYDSQGNLVSIVGTVQDITERKRVDEALRTSEVRYRSYVDVTGQIGWVTNADGEIVEDVPSLRKFNGQTYEEAKGSGWAKTLHPDDVESVLRVWNNAVSTKSPYETEYRMRRHDGVYRDLLARGYPVFRKDGSILEWVGTCIDITERKQAEETLRMNEARFRTLVENIPQKIFMKDRKVRWISINEKLAHDFGFRPEDVVGKTNADLFPPELAAKYQADDIRIMESGKTEELEEKYIQEGKETWVNTIKTPVKNANGEIIGVLGVFWDITDRKRLEDKLHQYTMQLEQKSRDLEQIIYVTSHDLRSPLVNVQGFAKELARSIMELMEAVNTGDISAEAMRRMAPILKNDIPESLDYIQSSITQMDMQLSALLKLSRLGRAAINIEKLDMDRLVDEVVKTLEFVAKEKGAKITVAKLPPCTADAAQTNQIFLNLIGNALKYLDAKRPGVIHIRGIRQETSIIYSVEDNGVGIPPECQDKIFEIFYRVEQNKCSGEGLGLTIVRQSAEKQNGTVWVESEPGKGSKFFVKLPGI